jgi:gluconate transporter
MACMGFIVGIPLFYNAGFVILVPLVFALAAQSKLSPVYLGVPLLAGLSIAHGFLPPHPLPAAIVTPFHADIGLTLLYGVIVAIPTLILTGPLFARTVKNLRSPPSDLFTPKTMAPNRLPGRCNSFFCALLPVMLIAVATGLTYAPWFSSAWLPLLKLSGDPMLVLLFSLLVATVTLGLKRGMTFPALMEAYGLALRDVSVILLIVAGAGALKQVLLDAGAGALIGRALQSLPVHPLLLGWLMALVIRICLGSATAAGLTAAALVQPLVVPSGVNPNLMVLAIGAGSLMCSHVNDTGFWLFKEYFNLSLKDTFRSWTLMATLVGALGLVFILMLNAVL